MATLELDPVFVKALKLLHSKAKDSTEQLKQMLDDVIAQRRGHTKSSDENERVSTKTSFEKSISKEEDTSKRRETGDKRSFDKLKQDPLEPPEVPVKKPRIESPQAEKETPQIKEKHVEKEKDKEKEKEQDSRDKEKKREKEAKEREKKEAAKKEEREKEREKERELKERANEKQQQKQQQKEKEKKMEKAAEESTDEEAGVEESEKPEGDLDKSMDADDFAVGLGIACVVCKQFDVTSTNQLVECQECHSLYHQECHKPPVIEQDVNDPRFVWYCSRCEKSLKKMVSKVQKPKVSPVVSAPPEKPAPVPRPVKPEGTSLFTFRREPKVSAVKEITGFTTAKPLSGLASLAANLSGQSKASSKVDPAKPAPAKPDLSKHGSLLTKSDQSDKPPTLTTSQSRERLKSLDVTASGGNSISNSNSSGNNNNNNSNNSNSSKLTSKASSDPQKSVSRPSLPEPAKSVAVFPKPSVEAIVNKSLSKQASTSKSSQGGASSVVNADKRLQMMKKKAAAKLQEKRSSSK
ncbi:hypothetical protein ACJMK2_019673 [Sinanodonta woodiana]|uniref:Integrator complex subunit 12 n=1 Tax=Sinanodonta woodiana TaxID=1069815 RepID=A0ABD3TZZ6_SINWO